MNIRIGFTFLVLSLLPLSCREQQVEWREYLSWLHNPEHNISQSKTVDDLEITVRLLPPEYLVFREVRENRSLSAKRDSLLAEYSQYITFTLTIAPDTSQAMERSVVFRKVYNYEQFVERVMMLNFSMEEFVTLYVDGKRYKPVLASLDNVYGLNNNATITFVFAAKDIRSILEHRVFDFEWNDLTYTTGIHHFIFTKEDIESIPTLQF